VRAPADPAAALGEGLAQLGILPAEPAKALLEKYQDRVIFIHVDQYQNPQAYKAYRVMGDPWTFAIDKDGIVRVERPGKMLYEEMEIAIQKILPANSSAAPQRVS